MSIPVPEASHRLFDSTSASTPGAFIAAAVRDLDEVADAMVSLNRYRELPTMEGVHLAVSLTHRIMLAISTRQRLGRSRDAIVERLGAVRAVHAESPFIRRLRQWQRGYPGDSETIEYLMRQENHAEPGRLAFWLEQYALDASLSQQHRNKVGTCRRAPFSTR